MKNLSSAIMPLALAALAATTASFGYTMPAAEPSNPFADIMCDSDRECEEATGYPYDTAIDGGPKYPRLVGIGCVGTLDGAPIYAFEEDHFPVGGCREIFEMNWEWNNDWD